MPNVPAFCWVEKVCSRAREATTGVACSRGPESVINITCSDKFRNLLPVAAQWQGGHSGHYISARTRNGTEATTWFPEVTHGLAKLRNGHCVVYGEVCVLDELGRSDFNQLLDRARRRRRYPGCPDVVYCVFDLLVHRGVDITQQPLLKRKAALAKLLKKPLPSIMYVAHFEPTLLGCSERPSSR